MEFRDVREEDLPAIFEIEERIMTMAWSLSSFKAALDSESSIFLLAEENNTIVGYMVLYVMTPEAELPDIVVDTKYQGRGIGRSLLEAGFTKLKENSVTDLFLEVRENNASARHLYSSLDFEETGIRKNFYRDPVENAICMHKNIAP